MPKIQLDDTIAALATPPGDGGIHVIRVSGKKTLSLLTLLFRSSKNGKLEEAPSHTIHHGFVIDEKGEALDEVLLHLFRAPHSYTGEEVVEISCHGGMRVAGRILELLYRNGARPAEAGEFTQRAFLNGKIDLTQAEAVSDLIRAKSEASLQAALRQLQGRLSEKVRHLKENLLKISAHLEAGLDFPDEHLETYSQEGGIQPMKALEKEMQALIDTFQKGLAAREGVSAVIVGRPNVGKSSLFNTLLEKDRALVTPFPGTTRDALEEAIEIGGLAVRLIDTAGMGEAAGGVPLAPDHPDRMAVERTQRYLREGQLFVFVVDGSRVWDPDDEKILASLKEKNFLLVVNKVDLPQVIDGENLKRDSRGETICRVSCVTQEGLPQLEKKMREKLISGRDFGESAILTRARHKQALEASLKSVRASRQTLEKGESAEFALLDLQRALGFLRALIGEIYSEDLLDVIFQEFCIGK